MKKLLFICSKNRLRSPTAEEVFSNIEGFEAIGCGISKEAPTALSGDLVEWADIIFTMENIHRSKVTQKYSKLLKNKRLICLDIPDNYSRMQPELVEILKEKVLGHL
ncbi:MAG: hypothetical protein NE328_06930 [Lentisphaeraceae bacterium]|nr:hypothetical protein [Lentisphaeraceae bacterium]